MVVVVVILLVLVVAFIVTFAVVDLSTITAVVVLFVSIFLLTFFSQKTYPPVPCVHSPSSLVSEHTNPPEHLQWSPYTQIAFCGVNRSNVKHKEGGKFCCPISYMHFLFVFVFVLFFS